MKTQSQFFSKNDTKNNTMQSFKTDATDYPKSKTSHISTKAEHLYGTFLHTNQEQEPKVIIKNPQVKKLIKEVENYGPYYSHCPTHNRRNLEFFGKMKTDQSIKLLTFIKDYRSKNKLII